MPYTVLAADDEAELWMRWNYFYQGKHTVRKANGGKEALEMFWSTVRISALIL